jgi:hypothetical protein
MEFLKKNWTYIILSLGFTLGLAFNLPYQRFVDSTLQKVVPKNSGVNISYNQVVLGTGLTLGLLKGGLVAFHLQDFQLTLSRYDFTLNCTRATVTPKILNLVKGQIGGVVACFMNSAAGKEESILAEFSVSPFYNPEKVSVELELNRFSLEKFESIRPLNGIKGNVSGNLLISDLSLSQIGTGELGDARFEWTIQGNEFVTPMVPSQLAPLPAMSLGALNLKGKFSESVLVLDEFKFGQDKAPIEGDLKLNLKLDPTGQPIEGLLSGRLRTDPNFEAAELSNTIPMDLYFGKVKENGFREFKKNIKDSFLSLLLTPPEPLN